MLNDLGQVKDELQQVLMVGCCTQVLLYFLKDLVKNCSICVAGSGAGNSISGFPKLSCVYYG